MSEKHKNLYSDTQTPELGTPKGQLNITHTPHELCIQFKGKQNKRNANGHKIIQLQNIKTELWLIIMNAYKANAVYLYLFTFVCKM